MIKLTITEKGGEPRALTFDQNEVSIGRVQGNDIVLAKGNISKRHSKLTVVDGRMVVADVKSTNGTYVNGRKIGEATPVRPGDKIFVGDFLIVIDPNAALTAEVTTGSRRTPPPPPPPPPRPGSGVRSAPAAAQEFGSVHDSAAGTDESGGGDDDRGGDSDFGDVANLGLGGNGLAGRSTGGVGSGRGRPPAPPPPPPRRTIATRALEDDSADIGMGSDEPPSPDDVAADGLGDPRGADDDDARLAGPADLGHDVFGSHPADDEDAVGAGGFPGSAEHSTHGGGGAAADLGAPSNDGGLMVTPPPLSASRAAALLSSGTGDTHAPGGVNLEALLGDPTVTSVVISGAGAIQVDRAGRIESIPAVGDGNAIAETVWLIANTAVPPPASDNPVVDVRLPDGTRVTALFPPITAGSVSAVIRKPGRPELPLADVAGSPDVESILRGALASRRNLLLAGDGPAVATLLATLADVLPSDRRVVTVGCPAKGRAGWVELAMGNDPAGLARAALAFHADHLLLADGGGAELPEVLLAAARGQEGLVACMAARSASEALLRLRAFTVGALGTLGHAALVASTLDLVIVVTSARDGGVRILEIAEPNADGEALTAGTVARRPEKNPATATLDVAGVSSRLASAIAASGDGLPGHLIRR